jgi:HEAT repeat protein
MNCLIVTVAIALSGVPEAARRAPSTGVPEGDVREQVETFLSTIDTPVTAQQWQALGPDAAPVLMEIASSQQMPSRRARAVEALGMRKDAAAANLVSRLATGPSEPKAVRLAAVRATPKLFAGADAQTHLAPLLQEKDPHLRAAAAGALASLGAGGCKLVSQRLQRETGEERALMERTTSACRKP